MRLYECLKCRSGRYLKWWQSRKCRCSGRLKKVTRETNLFCEHEDYCKCNTLKDGGIVKEPRCEQCTFYSWWDSGYGFCIALPGVIAVAWCRITCSLFKKRDTK